jgi:hypothetical protein
MFLEKPNQQLIQILQKEEFSKQHVGARGSLNQLLWLSARVPIEALAVVL